MIETAVDDTRQRLLDAAGKTFAEKGFRAATVREICRSAGANLAAVNYHFGDKEKLYIEAVKSAHCSRADDPVPVWPEGTPPAAKLHAFVSRLLAHILDDARPAWHAQLMMRELAEPTSACVALVDAYIRPLAQSLDQILMELLPANVAAADRHLTAFSVVGQCLFYKVHRPIAVLLVGAEEYATYAIPRLAGHITRFTLSALGMDPIVPELVEPVVPVEGAS